jgi:hypothetical protein
MRNVQRTASCGDPIAHDGAREEERCQCNEPKSSARTIAVATQATFNSDPDALLANGWEAGAVLLLEVSQQVLFAQHFGWHAFSAEAARMHDLAERLIGALTSATARPNEIMLLLSIGLSV